ncbi:SDR family oxidoreductase [Roseobacter sp. HKCCA0434]|uniref:SDR family oxidoreductase n=1 Tax=Roseobacter sp. HKCCA0434 TaxID=3079297 RepID=UPI002905C15C|nr:SDR family oxidoreductase [Roseobacter sp. HKCCA0434]
MRHAVVTGGAKGIGLGVVQHLAATGWRVAALDIDGDALEEMAGDAVLPIGCDTSDEDAVAAAFARIADSFGDQLHLLVNNAGISDPVSGPLEDLSLADWRRWQDAHVTSAFLATRAAVPFLRRARGSIVNIASTRAVMAEPDCEAYGTAKGALLGFTRSAAISLGPEIRVNSLLPGWIEVGALRPGGEAEELRAVDHAQHPAGRVGRAADIAAAIDYLASDGAGFVTGQDFAIDGGMTRKMIYAE